MTSLAEELQVAEHALTPVEDQPCSRSHPMVLRPGRFDTIEMKAIPGPAAGTGTAQDSPELLPRV